MLVHRRRLWPSIIQHWTLLSVGGCVSTEFKLTPIQCSVKCWASVAGAEQYPFSPSQYFMLADQHDALNQSSVNASTPSVTLAHNHPGPNTTLDGGLTLVNVSCFTACTIESAGEKWMWDRPRQRQTKQTEVKQYVPTSVYTGRHNKE